MSPGQTAPRGASKPHATDGIWYASYPRDVAHEIDPSRYRSLAHFFDECVERFRDRVGVLLQAGAAASAEDDHRGQHGQRGTLACRAWG